MQLEKLAEDVISSIKKARKVLEDGGVDAMHHAEAVSKYLELCKQLNAEPDPAVLAAYYEFLELYPQLASGTAAIDDKPAPKDPVIPLPAPPRRNLAPSTPLAQVT